MQFYGWELATPANDLVLSFLDTHVLGSGFDSMEVEVKLEGASIVNQTFNSVAAANAYLDDNSLNLGGLSEFDSFDMDFSLSLTTDDPGAGFSFDLLFGNSTPVDFDADFDDDDDVDGTDFLTWQRGLGIGAFNYQGDADGDQDVDGVDLTGWRNEFGMPQSSAAAGTVPEPGGAILAALALALLELSSRHAPSCRNSASPAASPGGECGRAD
jgi:hypothetical protein